MLCPLCATPCRTYPHPTLAKPYHICDHCYYIALDSTFHPTIERQKAQYDQHHNTLDNSGYVAMFERFLAPLSLDTPLDILEYGSGPGPVLATLLTQKGHRVRLYDPIYAPEILRENEKFDLITSTEVIEHVDDVLGLFRVWLSHLRPFGRIALMTQFHPEDEEAFGRWWYVRDPTHIGFFAPRSFDYLAMKFGLKILHIDTKSVVVLQKLE